MLVCGSLYLASDIRFYLDKIGFIKNFLSKPLNIILCILVPSLFIIVIDLGHISILFRKNTKIVLKPLWKLMKPMLAANLARRMFTMRGKPMRSSTRGEGVHLPKHL